MYNLFIILFLFTTFIKTEGQKVVYKFDKADRLLQAIYPDQKSVNYSYDKDGNRISQIITTIITSINPIADSLVQANNNIFIYPNPTNGNFKTRIYSSQKQQITLQIYTIDGKLIHNYSVEALKGYYDINITISPNPASGTYIVSVKGKTMNASKQIVITE